MQSWHLSKQSRPWYIRYVRFSRLVKDNAEILQMVESLSESRVNKKELAIMTWSSVVI